MTELLVCTKTQAQPQLNSCNSAKYGIAYYFNRDGKKLRENRLFTADEKGSSQNFDDRPAKVCNKHFPQVSKRESTNLFLWFCPLHGHCYDFHMIPGSEGRKEASASLYCCLQKPPKVVFYDFACSLSGRYKIGSLVISPRHVFSTISSMDIPTNAHLRLDARDWKDFLVLINQFVNSLMLFYSA